MLKILMKIKKIREVIFKVKALIIILAVLAIIGWSFAIYFNVSDNPKNIYCTKCVEKIEKTHSYSVLLEKSRKLIKKGQGLDSLEADIHIFNNGTLLAEWENVVFGGNRQEDIENYFDVIIDSIKFFSK